MGVFARIALVLCAVWGVEGARIRTAQIAATIVDTTTGAAVNTSYYFGLYGRDSPEVPVAGE